ncbi:MAG: aspartate--tRNA ligase [Syntrophales bacterium]|nr:aspartate--tRNA ligase [Syntrophales bacterium]HOG07276.1 aspartate--tRNA ligase [Syntrophales bacterium]HOS77493.1 aspartate--tRNA ligase [Syntrophales bacterium]HPB70619.1 aspartate--tRNA ligase [Syntrophales bacterium]HQN26145.1 aspartate--tRNA ligase [Syntrophales bacterium]
MLFSERVFCGQLTLGEVGRRVLLAGWVDAFRDHGGLLFIHLRDRSGIVQIVFSPEIAAADVCRRAAGLRAEYCIAVRGEVKQRREGTENPHIETGSMEVLVTELEVLSESDALPFAVSDKAMVAGAPSAGTDTVAEDLRLQYRYLDIRRTSMRDNLIARHRIFQCVRDFLDSRGFVEIETPVLTMSTPEGARDYLVPSRVHPENFYALPQSPQLFKQLLMIGGMERYFQLARCFRDEDLRPNRQPEFTQLDIEASFIDEEFLYELIEELTVRMFAVGGITLPRPFARMTHAEAMDTTGSDRPDLRFGLRFVDVTSVFAQTRYSIFRQILERGGCIKGINIQGQSGQLSKNVLQNEYAKEIVPSFGAKGMTWMRVEDGKFESNIVQFFSELELEALRGKFSAADGDVLILIADPSHATVTSALGQLRLHLANRLGLIPSNSFCPVWITEFPLFEATDEGGVTSSHHPFTAPDRADFDPKNIEELLSLRSRAYDLVINGEELGGGSIRINDRDLQRRIFAALGLTEAETKEKFGFFLRAFDFGAPPHGGLALGMDRAVSMILKTPSIREVIAFPKNRGAACPLTGAPSPVKREQLAELGLLNLGSQDVLPGTAENENRIDRLSWVSRIGLSADERPGMEDVLAQADALALLAAQNAGEGEALYTVAPVANRTRPGIQEKCSPLAETGQLLSRAPAVKGRFFKVASILE